MKIIGFSNKYYTLWDVTEHVEETEEERIKIHTYSYIKNISMDLMKVRQLYPDYMIDLTIKGHSSFQKTERLETLTPPNEQFLFGKYKGMFVDECKDIKYLLWYSEQIRNNEEAFEIVKNVLIDNGFIFYDNMFMTEEEYNEALKTDSEYETLKEQLKNHEAVDILFDRNLSIFYSNDTTVDVAGYIKVIGNKHITFIFRNYKEMYYNGFEYALPVDKKGKAKKIKNKTVRLTSYSLNDTDDSLIVYVNDFEILK